MPSKPGQSRSNSGKYTALDRGFSAVLDRAWTEPLPIYV
jgi:hypothetical protein